MNTHRQILKDFLGYLLLCVAIFLMARMVVLYFSFDDQVAFLKFKQEYLHIKMWKVAFYTHVFSSIFVLLAGFSQFSNELLAKHKSIHRFLGKLYVGNILFINFPAGLIMAVYANGYWPSKMAFLILDSLWFWFTLKALLEIKKKNIKKHQEYMIRSYALTCSAITLRTWKLILSTLFVIDPVTLYMIDAWLGFVPNLLFAEWIIYRKNNRLAAKAHRVDDNKGDDEGNNTTRNHK